MTKWILLGKPHLLAQRTCEKWGTLLGMTRMIPLGKKNAPENSGAW